MRDGFIFYGSFYEAIEQLDDTDRLAAFDMISRYALTGEKPEGASGAGYAIFLMAKPQIDANEQKRENGKKGGRPKTEEEPTQNLDETKAKPNDNLAITETEPKEKEKGKREKVNGKGKEKDRFTPPSVEEVRAYCAERGNDVDAEAFVAFYDSKGWKVGSQPMKNWRSAVVTWEKRQAKPQAKPPDKVTHLGKFGNFQQRTDQENRDMVARIIAMQRGG